MRFLLLAIALPVLAADPFAGLWKIDYAKSKAPEANVTKDRTVTLTVTDKEFAGVVKQGDKVVGQPKGVFDGKEHPSGNASAVGVMVLSTHPDARTVVNTSKRNGTLLGVIKYQVSADGKTLTSYVDGTRGKGVQVHSILVFEH